MCVWFQVECAIFVSEYNEIAYHTGRIVQVINFIAVDSVWEFNTFRSRHFVFLDLQKKNRYID